MKTIGKIVLHLEKTYLRFDSGGWCVYNNKTNKIEPVHIDECTYLDNIYWKGFNFDNDSGTES